MCKLPENQPVQNKEKASTTFAMVAEKKQGFKCYLRPWLSCRSIEIYIFFEFIVCIENANHTSQMHSYVEMVLYKNKSVAKTLKGQNIGSA